MKVILCGERRRKYLDCASHQWLRFVDLAGIIQNRASAYIAQVINGFVRFGFLGEELVPRKRKPSIALLPLL